MPKAVLVIVGLVAGFFISASSAAVLDFSAVSASVRTMVFDGMFAALAVGWAVCLTKVIVFTYKLLTKGVYDAENPYHNGRKGDY